MSGTQTSKPVVPAAPGFTDAKKRKAEQDAANKTETDRISEKLMNRLNRKRAD